jgi:hypothetical protein
MAPAGGGRTSSRVTARRVARLRGWRRRPCRHHRARRMVGERVPGRPARAQFGNRRIRVLRRCVRGHAERGPEPRRHRVRQRADGARIETPREVFARFVVATRGAALGRHRARTGRATRPSTREQHRHREQHTCPGSTRSASQDRRHHLLEHTRRRCAKRTPRFHSRPVSRRCDIAIDAAREWSRDDGQRSRRLDSHACAHRYDVCPHERRQRILRRVVNLIV